MSSVDEQARRLFLARWLTRRVTEAVGGVIPSGATRTTLEEHLAGLRNLMEDGTPLAGLAFDPPYPGRIAEDPRAIAEARLLLTCSATLFAAPLGAVFTVLIAGRRPEVSVAPPSAH